MRSTHTSNEFIFMGASKGFSSAPPTPLSSLSGRFCLMKTEISNKHIMFYADGPVRSAWESDLTHSCALRSDLHHLRMLHK